ncbi:hypothetical protein KKF91_05550 [Myxococcota bacterium]|nr:hypothetical protein [Myxococcota bacterium]MBU1430014.1 hypothetical protein [Myxococcota bacterium]MBU1899853.1 hypothetical protein [Myxococcota bacterium]
MATLAEILLNDAQRPKLIADCVVVIEEEVASKTGVTGFAVKAAFKAVKAFKKTIIPDAVEALVDAFVAQLEGYYAEIKVNPTVDIGAAVVRDADRVAEALLEITDQRAERNRHKALVSAYKKLRPQGKKHVCAAMPRVGAMLKRNGA